MKKWLSELDRLLRGEATKVSLGNKDGLLPINDGVLTWAILILGGIYGLCMGSYALFKPGGPGLAQCGAAILKVPLLFCLTLAVTMPSLYVSNALVGSKLSLPSIWRLMIASLAVNLAVLGSLGPIVAFFSWSTTSYSFMVMINVAAFGAAGLLGLSFLQQTLNRLTMAMRDVLPPPPPAPMAGGQPSNEAGPLDLPDGHELSLPVRKVFRCWMILFGLVGAQMAWVLRPFLGSPGETFTLFRPRGSSFFDAVWYHLQRLF